jgi:hypothetical protein
MVLMLEAMGIKLLISHNATPTTISAITMLIKGILLSSSLDEYLVAGLATLLMDPSHKLDNPASRDQAE